jgi:two-component system chemotaxis response regulator CheY
MAYKILIVDDSLPMRSVIKKTVKASGFRVGELVDASNGKEALDIVKRKRFDLVLTGYNMPGMDGLELIGEMKNDDMLKDIPIVMITAEGSQQRVAEFMEKGTAGYIKKPFTLEEIKSKLDHILGETEDGEEIPDNGDEELDF